MSKWMPTKDRLPKDNEEVLVCDKSGGIDIMRRDSVMQCWLWDDGVFYDGMFKGTNQEIIAWQPLPEPYKEEL